MTQDTSIIRYADCFYNAILSASYVTDAQLRDSLYAEIITVNRMVRRRLPDPEESEGNQTEGNLRRALKAKS